VLLLIIVFAANLPSSTLGKTLLIITLFRPAELSIYDWFVVL